MTQTSFVKALHKEAPGLISDFSATQDRDHPSSFAFRVNPAADGVRLSLKVDDGEPRDFLFATEEDAAKFLGRLYRSVKTWESALSLLLR